MGDYLEQRQIAMQSVMQREEGILASKHLLITEKIDKVIARNIHDDEKLKQTICSQSPLGKIKLPVRASNPSKSLKSNFSEDNVTIESQTINKLLTRRLKRLIEEKEYFEQKSQLGSSLDVQLIKIDDVSHVADAYRENLVGLRCEQKFGFEKWGRGVGSKKSLDPKLLELKRKFVVLYLDVKAKVPVAMELTTSGK